MKWIQIGQTPDKKETREKWEKVKLKLSGEKN